MPTISLFMMNPWAYSGLIYVRKSDSSSNLDLIKKKSFTGIQLFYPKEKLNDFKKDYLVEALPRHIISDQKAQVVDFNAEKPSNETLEKNLFSLIDNNAMYIN